MVVRNAMETLKKIEDCKTKQKYVRLTQVGISYHIDLTTWQSIFQTLKKTKLTVTIDCEEPHLDFFCIGTLQKIGKRRVDTLYFSPDGIVDEKPTMTEYNNITKVSFDDRYANILTKYVKPKA